jgi:hypothetical protein
MSITERATLSELAVPDLLARASVYRGMAATARTAQIRDALLRLAERMEKMAAKRATAAHDAIPDWFSA